MCEDRRATCGRAARHTPPAANTATAPRAGAGDHRLARTRLWLVVDTEIDGAGAPTRSAPCTIDARSRFTPCTICALHDRRDHKASARQSCDRELAKTWQ